MNVAVLFDEFDQQLAVLCAAYNKPCNNERREAYRKSLGKLSPVAWTRLVEHCIGEGGPKDLPTTGECWRIYRGLRARPPEDSKPAYTAVHFTPSEVFANRLLCDWLAWHIRGHGEAIAEPLARELYTEAHQLAGQMQMLRDEGDPAASAQRFLSEFCSRVLTQVSVDTARRYEAHVVSKQWRKAS